MATLLFQKHRLLRTLALLASIALVIGVRSSSSRAAGNDPTSIRFRLQNTACGAAPTYEFKINNTVFATGTGTASCSCGNNVIDVTVNSAAALAAASGTCVQYTVTQVGTGYMSYARADVTRPSGNEVQCMLDRSGTNCAVIMADLCNASATQTSNLTAGTILPDDDQDSIPNCSDTDFDNDGVLNTVDNCPVVSNANQADTDGNGIGDACQPALVAVPWQGAESLPHQVTPGGTLTLQAAAFLPGNGLATPLTSASWTPGDGTGPFSIPFTNSLNLELAHIYNGAVGQPYTATVTVVAGGVTLTDTFKVIVAANSRETKVNMAIDKGLWNLHKTLTRTTADGVPAGFWTGAGFNLAATASAVQSFEINNHRESADPLRDPYGNDVARGLAYLTSQANIQKLTTFGLQNGNNPDSNGNGYGLWVLNNDHSTYIGGQVIDALVASGTPNKVAVTGINPGVKGRTYKDIVADLLDGYSWGIADNTGGWHYGMQDVTGNNDTSASHWWAIGVLASHTWGLDAPQWVKDIQKNIGIPLMQAFTGGGASCVSTPSGTNDNASDGHFGYTNNKHWEWDLGTNTTAAGLVLMNGDGMSQNDDRFKCASKFVGERYTNSLGNFYTMYQVTKAMRTAFDNAGVTTPITNLNGNIDWYAGYADFLVTNQNAAGAFTSGGTTGIGTSDLSSAWAIIILSPSLFELPPAAACTVSPATIGKNGGTVNFSAAASFHPDASATITGYSWNFDDSTAAGSGVTTSHAYAVPASFPTTRNATVTVTDSNGNSSTASCPVEIVNNNVPPAATIAGPYTVCKGAALTLTATATDEDGTVGATAWDLNEPTDFSAIDATGLSVNATAIFASKAPGTYDIGFRATDDNSASTSVFSTVTILAANNPACNQPPTINMPPNQTIEATSPAGAVATFAATASDDHDTITPICTPASGSTFGINASTSKTTTVTCTATDNDGLSASGTMTVTVQDTTAPTITVPGDFTVHSAFPNGSANVTFATSATDIVDVTDPVTCDHVSGSIFPLGSTTVKCSSTDQHNNTSLKNFIVTVANAAPVAQNDEITLHGNTAINVLINDSDADGDSLTVAIVGGPSTGHGTVFVNPDKTVQYNPFSGQANNDSFTYQISDGRGGTSTATVTITVTNAAPIAVNDTITLAHNVSTVVIPVRVNDSDPDGDSLTFLNISVGANCHCSPFTSDETNGTITYTSLAGPAQFSSPAQFTYTIRDKYGATAVATVTVNFTNAAPAATPFFLTTHGLPVTVSVLANASDPDGDTLALVGACGGGIPANIGFCNFNVPAGTVTFTPNPQWFGPQFQVGYTVTDGHSATASSFIRFTYVNQLPVGGHPTFATTVNTPLQLSEDLLLVGSSDPDGDHVSIENIPTVQHGTITVNGDDQGIYTPNPGFIGIDTITFEVDDLHGGVVTSTGTITVTAPTITAVSAAPIVYGENGVIIVQVGSNASTPVAGNLTLTVAGSPSMTQPLVNAAATFTVGLPTAGSHAITASYAGQDFYLSSEGAGTLVVSPAPTNTVVTCTPSVVFNGAAQTVCSAHVTGAAGLDADVTPVTYTANTNVGTAGASATYAGDANRLPSTGTSSFAITKAPSTTVVTCDPTTVYNGSAQSLCSAHVTGIGGLDADVTPVTYTANTNVGTATGSATFVGDDNHSESTGSATFAITKAPSTTVVTCAATTVYTGAAQTLCTAHVTGIGSLDADVTPVTYTANTNVGTATGNATYAGDDNHASSSGSSTFAITKAPSVTVVTCPASVEYTGAAQTVCSANVTGAGNLDQSVTPVTYLTNTNVGTASAKATFAGDDNHVGSYGAATFAITKKSATVTADSKTKVYGTADPVIGATSTGFVPSDSIAVSYSGRATGNTVGSYATHATATGTAVGNYDVTYVDGALSITKAPLTVTVNNKSKTYLAANPVLNGTVTGVVAGDTITASYSTTAVTASVPGVYPITATLADPGSKLSNYTVSNPGGTLTITNAAPVCTAAVASPNLLWPPNHKLVPIKILNVTDPDGNPVTLTVTSIFQDEPTNDNGDGNTSIDATGVGTSNPSVRAERSGDDDDDNHYSGDNCDHERGRNGHHANDGCGHEHAGNGRVYHIRFTATDGLLSCTGDVTVGVPHDQGHGPAVDNGPVYDSTKAGPLANDDSYTGRSGIALSITAADGVLDNDSSNAVTAVLVTNPAHGTVALNASGAFVYTSAANYVGYDTFTYRAVAANGALSAPATVTIKVKKNTPPVADNDAYNMKKGTTLITSAPGVLIGDVDAEGDPITAVLVAGPTSGTFTFNANGSFTFKPSSTSFTGTVTFTYKVKDSTGLFSNVATVTINVLAHWDGDNCDHDRGRNGHRGGDGCDHDRGEHGGHWDGDGCDHARNRPGHRSGDNCDHDKNTRTHNHHDGDDCDHDNHRNGHRKGDGCDHDRG